MDSGRHFFILIGRFDASLACFGFVHDAHSRVMSISRCVTHVDGCNLWSQGEVDEDQTFANVLGEEVKDREEEEEVGVWIPMCSKVGSDSFK